MSDLEEDLVFDSLNGVKCENFIRFIRRRVLASGTQRDDQLIAETAAACFDGPVLLWYEELDLETQESWKALRRALLTRWLESNASGSAPSAVTAAHIPASAPAAASPQSLTPAAPAPLAAVGGGKTTMVGRIRVVSEADGSSLGYVSRHLSSDGLYVAKAHQGDAQMFNFTSSSKPTNMYLGEIPSPLSMLSVVFDGVYGTTEQRLCDHLHKGSVAWGGLAIHNGSTQQSSSTYYDGISVPLVWNILVDNEITLLCKSGSPSSSMYCRLHMAIGDLTGAITIMNDFDAYLRSNRQYYRGSKGRFFFEPL